MNILGRVITTVLIWIVGVVGVMGLINQIARPAYTLMEQPSVMFGENAVQNVMVPVVTGTEYAPFGTIIVLAVLALFLIIGMMISTSAIWQQAKPAANASQDATNRASAVPLTMPDKAKRDQQARLQRLLARMDPDDLAALEHHLTALEDQTGLGADGELISVDPAVYGQPRRQR